MAITNLFEKFSSVFSGFLTQLLIALLILLIGIIIGKVLGKLVQRVLHEVELNSIVKRAAKIRINMEEFIAAFITYFIYFIAVVIALKEIGLATIILDIISAAIILIIVVAVFLGIKDFIPNMMAGVFLHQKKLMKEGDIIRISGAEGEVVYINLIETKIKTADGDTIHIPNSMLTREKLVVKEGKKRE